MFPLKQPENKKNYKISRLKIYKQTEKSETINLKKLNSIDRFSWMIKTKWRLSRQKINDKVESSKNYQRSFIKKFERRIYWTNSKIDAQWE